VLEDEHAATAKPSSAAMDAVPAAFITSFFRLSLGASVDFVDTTGLL
jgi:hypothetical protein